MIIRHNNVTSDTNTNCFYCSAYSAFTKQELIDWAVSKSFDYYLKNGENILYILTDIQSSTEYEQYLTFKFLLENDYYSLNKIDKNCYWRKIMNNVLSAVYESRYASAPFKKKMDFDLDTLYDLYNNKYKKVKIEFTKKLKEKQQIQKLINIETDELEGEFIFMAEKYGYEFSSEFSSTDPTTKNYHFNKQNIGSINFWAYRVKKYNLVCWKVTYDTPYAKYSYDLFIKDFDSMKKVAEGYMTMFKEKLMFNDYHSFIEK